MTDLVPRLQTALAGRYTVERELGRGGMATVYLAQDLKHSRPVAIKVLRPELAAALGPERFLREIQLTANLQHPHILPLYDSGSVSLAAEPPSREAAEFLFYVMPLVEGESLRDRLTREKQLPLEETLAIARQVAAALGYAAWDHPSRYQAGEFCLRRRSGSRRLRHRARAVSVAGREIDRDRTRCRHRGVHESGTGERARP
jgi:serine/threonine protein kinase